MTKVQASDSHLLQALNFTTEHPIFRTQVQQPLLPVHKGTEQGGSNITTWPVTLMQTALAGTCLISRVLMTASVGSMGKGTLHRLGIAMPKNLGIGSFQSLLQP